MVDPPNRRFRRRGRREAAGAYESGRQGALSRLAVASVGIALLVLALKTLAWRLTGSVALFSDALESIVNVVTAAIAWYALRVGARPADDDHPFGHHKAEYFSAVIGGLLILLAAIEILREAIISLGSGSSFEPNGIGLALAVLATLFNLVWSRLLIEEGERLRSPALAADGRHVMTDVWTSVGVLVGLVLVLLSGLLWLDAVAALLVGLNILREGWRVVRGAVDGLMDKALDESETRLVADIVIANASGAIEVHDVKTRSAGAVRFAEFHLVVDGAMSVSDSHAICDRIEHALLEAMPDLQVSIHVEPGHERRPEDGLPIEEPR